MRDDELRRLLRDRNPWWKLAAREADPAQWTERDPVLSEAARFPIEYSPEIVHDVAPPGLCVLRGPRRIGKSVICKRLIARICRRRSLSPWQIVYLSVDGMRQQDLRRAFKLARELTAPAGSSPRMWVIDEITSVEGWVPLVKELRDNSELAFDGVVLTGSSAVDLDDARRSLGAGRTKLEDPFRVVLPMSFREYLNVTLDSMPLPEVLSPDVLMSDSARSEIQSLAPFVDDFDLAWQRFLECGGFPRAVGEVQRDGEPSRAFVFDLMSWLNSDVDPTGPAESIARLLNELHIRTAAPFNVRNAAEALGTTRERLQTRLNRLISTFAAFRCSQLGKDGEAMPSSQSKLYLLDPLLARLPHLRDATFAEPDMTRLSETQIALELARAVDRLVPDRFIEHRAVFYARTENGNEVDFGPIQIPLPGTSDTTVPLESKWVPHSWRREALVMRGKYGRGILATKDVLDLSGDIWAVPSPLVALLLN